MNIIFNQSFYYYFSIVDWNLIFSLGISAGFHLDFVYVNTYFIQ